MLESLNQFIKAVRSTHPRTTTKPEPVKQVINSATPSGGTKIFEFGQHFRGWIFLFLHLAIPFLHELTFSFLDPIP